MSSSASQTFSKYHYFLNNKNTCTETKKDRFYFICLGWWSHYGARFKNGNAYGVIQVSKEWILLRILITYWGRRVCIFKVFMFLSKNIIKQDKKNFSIPNRLRRTFFINIHKISKHIFQVYRISHLMPLNGWLAVARKRVVPVPDGIFISILTC